MALQSIDGIFFTRMNKCFYFLESSRIQALNKKCLDIRFDHCLNEHERPSKSMKKYSVPTTQQQRINPPATAIDMFTPAQERLQVSWTPLDLNRIVEHVKQSRAYERIIEYLAHQEELFVSERVIIFFLHAVYDDSFATIALYARYTVALFNHAQKEFYHINSHDIDAFIRHHQIQGSKPGTINTIIGALKSFFRHLVDAGILTVNPTAFVKKKRYDAKQRLPGHLSHSLSDTELQQLFEGMAVCGASLRDQALFKVLFLTGIRAEEAVRLKWSHLVCWQTRWYLDVFGKGSKRRRVYIPKQALAALNVYREHMGISEGGIHKDSRPLFAHLRKPHTHISRHGLYVLVKKWCTQLLGRTDISPHWFRHSCFTQLAHKGASLESIKTLAGHESVETTMQYNEAAQLMQPAGMLFEDTHE